MSDHPKCAAGDLCAAPDTADEVSRRHICCDCKKPVHSVFCSTEYSSISDNELKNAFKSCDQQGSFKEVCSACLAKERQKIKERQDKKSSADSSSDDDDGDDDSDDNSHDGDRNNNVAAASKPDVIDPWLFPDVSYDDLKHYTAFDLKADRYYINGDENRKPVILFVMCIGLAGIPDHTKIKTLKEIANVTNRATKAYLCPISDIQPDTKNAVPHIRKEVIRRCITKKITAMPRIASWKKTKMIEWLKQNPPLSAEHEHIRKCYRELLNEYQLHYLLNSGGMEANLFRLLRAFECLLHRDLRPKFITRDDQLSRPQIDGRNSSLRPKTFYEDAAEMYNSKRVLSSRNFNERYGEPFHQSVPLHPPTADNNMTAGAMKKIIKDRFRGSIISVRESIRLSGQGDGAIGGSMLKDFVHGPKAKPTVRANGHATGYWYAALEEEGVLDDYCQVLDRTVAATMTNVPRINSNKKKRSSTSKSSAKKKRGKRSELYDDDDDGVGIGAISLLKRMEMKSSVADAHARVSTIRAQITQDQSTLPQHQERKRNMFRQLKPFRRRVNEGTLSEGDEDWDEYVDLKEDYDGMLQTIENVKRQIEELKEELQLCTKDLEAAMKAAKSAQEGAASSESEEEKDGDGDGGDNDSVVSGASNDGSRELNNNEVTNSSTIFSDIDD